VACIAAPPLDNVAPVSLDYTVCDGAQIDNCAIGQSNFEEYRD